MFFQSRPPSTSLRMVPFVSPGDRSDRDRRLQIGKCPLTGGVEGNKSKGQLAKSTGSGFDPLGCRIGGHGLNIQSRHHSVRLLAVVFSIDVCPCMRGAGMPEPLLSRFDPAGFPVNELGDRPAQNMCRRSLDEAGRINHRQILFDDQVNRRPC